MRKHVLAVIGLMLLLCLLAALGTASGSPGTFTVNSTVDPGDGTCDATECTLREAISAANANPGSDTIAFHVFITDTGYMVSGITGTWTISLTASLPTLTDGSTVISGTTQAVNVPGYTNPDGPEIEIAGAGMASGNCLAITGANNMIHGLVINRCPEDGIHISGSKATTNTISGNYIGTDASGTQDLGNTYFGVAIITGAQNNIIGPDNIISGNGYYGVFIYGSGTDGNTVSGNYIGTDASGLLDRGNGRYGVYIYDGPKNNIIGPDNIISGNDWHGVDIDGDGTDGNTVSGNYIGTDITGTQDLGNSYYGVAIIDGAQNNVIGGDTPGERNVISGNDYHGVFIYSSGTNGNTVSGNYIGTDASGTQDLGNSYYGVRIENGAQNNIIGGSTEEERNVISGNGSSGVSINGIGTDGNTVSGNYIGTDVTGTQDLGNSVYGVRMENGAQNNVIGGSTEEERNVISGNDDGVVISDGGTDGNTVSGNYIGTDVTSTQDLGNTEDGVIIGIGAQNNVIGGDSPGEGNVISGNDKSGVLIENNGTDGNTVSGNYIGTNALGLPGLGNTWCGVRMYDGVKNNVIGGDTPGERNVIAFNGLDGIEISDDTSTGNAITQNSIHNNAALGIELRTEANGGITAPSVSAANTCFAVGTAGSALGPFTLDTNVTATATDGDGNTSEFSVKVSPGTCHQIFLPLIMKNY